MTHCGTGTIETERLLLRKLRADDAEAMFRNWASDPEVTRFLTWPPHKSADFTRELLSEWVKNYERADYYQWGIELKAIGEVIGTISVVGMDEQIGMAHIGYCIGRDWWHQGIMTETLRAVLSYLFENVRCCRIESRYDINNPHSGQVMKKCGMRFEGILRSAARNNQGICDVGQYAILLEDYLKGSPS
ncbi:MAG: GNAT family N-acetyltransferase [Clostridia bacterium]|nr:GNAT family N-acetyltransferase [Clostridia bacterium]